MVVAPPHLPVEWRRAAFMSNSVVYLTAAELAEVMDEVNAIYTRYRDRNAPEQRPATRSPSTSTRTDIRSRPLARATDDHTRADTKDRTPAPAAGKRR